MANPTYEKVLEGAKLVKEHQVDFILGVGDGSVIDCCKAISIASRYKGNAWQDFGCNQESSILNHYRLG